MLLACTAAVPLPQRQQRPRPPATHTRRQPSPTRSCAATHSTLPTRTRVHTAPHHLSPLETGGAHTIRVYSVHNMRHGRTPQHRPAARARASFGTRARAAAAPPLQPLRNLPQMCSSTTKAMKSRLSTSTVVGPLRAVQIGNARQLSAALAPSRYRRGMPQSRPSKASHEKKKQASAHIFRPGASSV